MSGANGSKALPRLGAAKTPRAKRRTEVVELPDRGVSVLIGSLDIETFLDVQDSMPEGEGVRERFEQSIELVAKMLIEPKLDPEALRAEVVTWSASDWMILQNAAIALAGFGEGVAASAAAFPPAGQ